MRTTKGDCCQRQLTGTKGELKCACVRVCACLRETSSAQTGWCLRRHRSTWIMHPHVSCCVSCLPTEIVPAMSFFNLNMATFHIRLFCILRLWIWAVETPCSKCVHTRRLLCRVTRVPNGVFSHTCGSPLLHLWRRV